MNKWQRQLVKLAKKYGRRLVDDGHHLRLASDDPDIPDVRTSKSPSDVRTLQNLEATLRKPRRFG